MSRVALLALFLAVAATSHADERRARFMYTPHPDFAKLRQHEGLRGAGVFVLHMDVATGAVRSVAVEKSTGSKILDDIAVETFQKWRAKPHDAPPHVHVPMNFTGKYHPD